MQTLKINWRAERAWAILYRLLAGVCDPSRPSSSGCRHGCAERRQMDTGINPDQKGDGRLAFNLACILESTLPSRPFMNAQWMHTYAFACFPCLCVWDQTSLAMGRWEVPKYTFHSVHLPPPLALGHRRVLSKCCWDPLKSHMLKTMAMNFSSGCSWALLCIHMLLRQSHSTNSLWFWYFNEIIYGNTGTTWMLKKGCVMFFSSKSV